MSQIRETAMAYLSISTSILGMLLANILLGSPPARALSPAFTFQGQLQQSGLLQNGNCDFQFSLYDAASGGSKLGATQTTSHVTVQDGLFTVTLNAGSEFGANAFDGNDRWLEMAVRCPAGAGSFSSPFVPRQALTVSPYATFASRTASALDLACSGCIASSDLAPNAVTSEKIQDASITSSDLADSSVTSAKIADLTIGTNDLGNAAVTPAKLQPGSNGQVLTTVGGSVAWQAPAAASGWGLTGNSGTTSSNFIGTTDAQPLELRVNNTRVWRLELAGASLSPNSVGGSAQNSAASGTQGATISGGGRASPNQNLVYDSFGTIGGGERNRAGTNDGNVNMSTYATVGGGQANIAAAASATVGGGTENSATGNESTIAGGLVNSAAGTRATVAGGGSNSASALAATVGGGDGNQSSAPFTTVAGGNGNTASADGATVCGGTANTAGGASATVGGGEANSAFGVESYVAAGLLNSATGDGAVVGGGRNNQSSAALATIAGGGTDDPAHPERGNRVHDDFGAIGGGSDNQAGNHDGNSNTQPGATVGGGIANRAIAAFATISGGGGSGNGNAVYDTGGTVSGGARNSAGRNDGSLTTDTYAVVGGGAGNRAAAKFSTVGGGGGDVQSDGNAAFDNHAVVSGGQANQAGIDDGNPASQAWSSVGGGFTNRALASAATVAGGNSNTASGLGAAVCGGQSNTAGGSFAAIPGGNGNSASGQFSFAAGRQADANFDGCFVWSDSNAIPVSCGATNRFVARAAGGVHFLSNATGTAGVQLAAGSGSWSMLSDRHAKHTLEPVDPHAILERVTTLPIHSWSYATQEASIRHVGPMAQDFAAAFQVGEDDRMISSVDADGVALAAIQALHAQLRQRDSELAALRERLAIIEQAVERLSAPGTGVRQE
jgi:hypothetical protein